MPGNGAAAGASYGDLLVTSLLVLGAVCVAAYIAVRVFGRLLATGRARGAHLLDVVARVPLEPRRSLYVVEVAGKTLLVGTSEMGLSVLSELDGSEVKTRVQAQQSFGELVRAAWQRRKTRWAQTGASTTAADASVVSSSTPQGESAAPDEKSTVAPASRVVADDQSAAVTVVSTGDKPAGEG
jgi:flagellar protein FliO/FliZ